MIIPKQPSIEQNKHPRDLIAHIEPVDDDLVSNIDAVLEDDDITDSEDSPADDKDSEE